MSDKMTWTEAGDFVATVAYLCPHKAFNGVTCLGLVHAEKCEGPAKIDYICNPCNTNPRQLEEPSAGPSSVQQAG